MTINPYHTNRMLMSPNGVAGLLTVLVSMMDAKNSTYRNARKQRLHCLTVYPESKSDLGQSSLHDVLPRLGDLPAIPYHVGRRTSVDTDYCSRWAGEWSMRNSANPLPSPTPYYQAVDVVGQAGRPKTITGFQTHSTPVLMAYTERAETATDEYLPLTPVLEGLVSCFDLTAKSVLTCLHLPCRSL